MNLFGWNKKQIAQYQDNPISFKPLLTKVSAVECLRHLSGI
jgi:hypothetical protein